VKSSPYRRQAHTGVGRDRARRWTDVDLLLAAALFWIVSLLRVVGGFLRKETFDAEATLALVVVVGIPWVLLHGRGRSRIGNAEASRASLEPHEN
jgi:hypothetical protein